MSEATTAPAETKSPSPSGAGQTADIFWISVLGLFLELLLIRWIGTEIRIFAYLQNTILVVCFLGLGMGCLTCRQPFNLRDILLPLTVLLLLMAIPFTREALGRITEMLSSFGGMTIWAQSVSESPAKTIFSIIAGLGLTFLLMALIWDIFLPVGRLLGRLLDEHPHTIWAYSVNVAGSLVGVWAFVLCGALSLPPVAWFGVTVALLLYFAWRNGMPKIADMLWLAAIVGLAAITGYQPSATESTWSPYQKLVLYPVDASGPWKPGAPIGQWQVNVNHANYQEMIDLDPTRLPKEDSERFPAYMRGLSQYDLPTLLHAHPRQVLIVGAGSGNDAAGAVRNGAGKVVAVDIDPVIIDMGRRYHPEKPYSNPAVHVVNDDARSFFASTPERFDVISFGLLDSHTTTSMNNARLDHYVYTEESLRRARDLLSDDGVLVLNFLVEKPFIGDRMARTLREVFGQEPLAFWVRHTGFGRGGMMFVAAAKPESLRAQIAAQPRLKEAITRWQQETPLQLAGTARIATDDWPYLYLESPSIPLLYFCLAGLLLLLLARGLRRVQFPGLFRSWDREHWHFFFLGAAFLLLEVQNISKAAVVLGNTWQINAVIISGILALVLISNVIVARLPNLPAGPVYVLLCGSCVALYFVDLSQFAFLPYGLKALVVGGVTSLPMLFSGIVFIRSFAAAQRKDTALGANLLGALVGALLQSVTFVTGIKALLLIVLAFYIAALLTRPTGKGARQTVGANPVIEAV